MFARILLIPCILGLILALYLTDRYNEHYSIWAIPFGLLGALVLIFSPQINWWWYQRYPPKLGEPGVKILEANFPYYKKLSSSNKLKFEQRLSMYIKSSAFVGKFSSSEEDDDVPLDLKIMPLANAVQLTFGFKDYIIKDFETVVFFAQPFPSPNYPKNKHASEINIEDKVLIFSIEQLAFGFKTPTAFYNLGLHEYSKALIYTKPDLNFPEFNELNWDDMELISTWSKETVESVVGLPGHVDILNVAIHHFFVFPAKFNVILPQVYQLLSNIFNQNPLEYESPLIVPLETK
jgi:Mlc titration factor MtfA (ptsG expression regulator)